MVSFLKKLLTSKPPKPHEHIFTIKVDEFTNENGDVVIVNKCYKCNEKQAMIIPKKTN
ncbi:MAG: hypothetical protein ACI4XL_04900 [Bacillus sp. (in: firmicutes)]